MTTLLSSASTSLDGFTAGSAVVVTHTPPEGVDESLDASGVPARRSEILRD